jgi:hypothetical protein
MLPTERTLGTFWRSHALCAQVARCVPRLPVLGTSVCEVFDVGEHDFGVTGWIGDVVRLSDNAIGVNEIREPLRKVRVLMARIADSLVNGADGTVNVGKQRVAESFS